MASTIKNVSVVYDQHVDANRKAIGHRADWMGRYFTVLEEAGIDAEKYGREAVSGRGKADGKDIAASCEDPTDLRQFADAFLDNLAKTTFQMEFQEITKDDLKIEFHYCPLVAAWKKMGYSDEKCATLCDIAMDGDRNIAGSCGLKLELTDTIAKGCPTCKLHFHKK